MTERERLVVIGNGMAGARFVEELLGRGGGERYAITIFGDEPYGNYNRILLSSVLAQAHEPKDIFLNPIAWYAESGVKLHLGVRATAVDTTRREVRGPIRDCSSDGGDGIVEPYDKLVFATGSRAFIPPIQGLGRLGQGGDANAGWKEGVHVFRTLDDCNAILAGASRARRAAVIGGGLLGLEAARGLLGLGLEVHVVHLMSHLMEVQLDRRGGETLQRTLASMGVHFHLEKKTEAVLGDERVTGLRFADGTTLDCELLVISCGIQPNVALAKAAGLEVRRGIIVGDDLATPNDPRVFALGECAEHQGRTYGLVAPLWEQAAVLADRLSEKAPRALYQGSKIATRLKVMGVDLSVMGAREAESPTDEEIIYSDAARGVYKKLVLRAGRLAGAVLLGETGAAPALLEAFDRDLALPENPAELLFPSSSSTAGPPGVGALDDAAQICNCNGVSKGEILAAIGKGHRTLEAVCCVTRAGMGCGSCKGQVRSLVDLGGGATEPDPSVHYYVPGVPLPKSDLVRAIREQNLRSVSAVFAALAGGVEDPASKPGLASLLKTLWGSEYEDERDARFINDRVHANIQKDRTFSVVPRIYGGVTSPAELRRIADVAERYQVRMVKITGGQRIDLLGVAKEQLPHIWRDLGMPSGHAYAKAFRTCKTCVGTDFCRYGVGDSIALGIRIEKRYQGIEFPAKVKLATAGCPRNCSEATTKDIGAVAIEGGKWEVLVGGAAGSRVRRGELLCVVETHDEVLRVMGRFMQFYRENARYLERTYDFVERLGIEHLRRVLVDDAEGICARLDEAIGKAVDAYVDPWQEAAAPVHPAQFRTRLPIVTDAVESVVPARTEDRSHRPRHLVAVGDRSTGGR